MNRMEDVKDLVNLGRISEMIRKKEEEEKGER